MSNKIILLLFAGLITMHTAKGQHLEHFIQLALENHPQLNAAQKRHEAATFKVGQFTVWQDPSLNVGYNVTPNSMQDASVALMQNFAWFGKVNHQKKAANWGVESSFYELEDLKQLLIIDLSTAYFDLQEIQERIDLQNKQLKIYREFKSLATNKLATSKGTMVDVIRAELNSEDAILQLDLLEKQKQLLVTNFNVLVGREPSATIEVSPVSIAFSAHEKNVAAHPALRALDMKRNQAAENSKVIEKEGMPSWGLGVQYMLMNPDMNANRHEFMPMLSVSLPIFRKKYKAQKQEADAWVEAFKEEKEWKLNQLERELNVLNNGLYQNEQKLVLYTQQIKNTERAKELLLNYYATSSQDFEELQRLQQQLFTYEEARIKARREIQELQVKWNYVHAGSNESTFLERK